jgi:hypothetical protein
VQEGGDATFMTTDPTSAAVSATTKQAGPIQDRWSWVEPAAWTKRMLTALEQGVQGGVWFSLMDKAYHQRRPNAFFAEQGLMSTVAAHVQACQSSLR